MNRFNRSPSPEYRAFVEDVQEYADADHEPGEGVRRAIADALSDELRERFKEYWKVDEQAETPCLRRLITGADECTCDRSWRDRQRERLGERDEPPHKPPHSDHASLWLDENDEPGVFSMHIYHPHRQRQRNGWFDIVQCAEHWGLDIAVMPTSWYYAMSTVNIVFYPPERFSSSTD